MIAQILKDLERCGLHGKIHLKGDQEAAIQDLLKEIARARGNKETVIECSPVRDSSGNGAAEKGCKHWRG